MDSSARPSATAAKRVMLFGSVGLIVLGGALLAYFFGADIRAQDAKAGPRGPVAVSVAVATVKQQDVAFNLNVIGNAEARATVAVKARVDGQIVEVGFTEGQEVREGQMLFKIDPRPFETTLRQAEATFLRDTAQKDQTRSQERRYQELLQKNFVSKEAYAQIRTNAEAADAVALASRAAVDNARLQLEYCTIRSPIEAYPGKIQIQKGNLVKANDANALVVLNQVSPIYVSFAVPEQELSRIRAYMSKGPLAVEAGAPKADKPTATGQLIFVDNAVDPSTGTIKLRAQFPNKDRSLWPGQFVAVRLKLYDQKNAIVIPTQSVQTGPEGQHVVVVKLDMTAEVRKVIVDRTDGDNTIIAKGLTKGEQVVTQGQMRLAPGTKVAIKPS